ncbi:Stp1/IreP family PP2C-type Ser/Thr phosphatase [Gloeocapsa sp. PCC 73106]|uniref:Stp1/IreP family PP2C-type Ser/Thr phosphatase n=1 Tax=Gloeocapsa sp. PCC 73106 TaxID=102232 RepID=UPI0002AD1499|nr:Stp1/IreP family PP2C-type Ser/Thr phosphatase [Gloeocapsa sp. PCC 73106]ELR99466.1 serine/threonine protein phosphatase [Gloeocapsa sp. PCC 73106]
MKLRFTGLSDLGLVRSVNQDSYYVDDPGGRFFIVADGMGGHAGGQEASSIAIKEIQAYLEKHWDDPTATDILLEQAFSQANQGILKDQSEHPDRGDMGTTAVLLLFRGEASWAAHVGDSRLYRLRAANLEQVTEDHTWVARAIKNGDLTREEARIHPWRHVLSQCLGRKDIYQIDLQTVEVQPGDRFLLCSDGLTEEVPDELISKLLAETPEQAAQMLVEEAKEAGGSDNITVVIVETF